MCIQYIYIYIYIYIYVCVCICIYTYSVLPFYYYIRISFNGKVSGTYNIVYATHLYSIHCTFSIVHVLLYNLSPFEPGKIFLGVLNQFQEVDQCTVLLNCTDEKRVVSKLQLAKVKLYFYTYSLLLDT